MTPASTISDKFYMIARRVITAGRACAGITRLFRLFGVSPTKVVCSGMDHYRALLTKIPSTTRSSLYRRINTYTQNTLLSNELDVLVFDTALGITLTIRLEIAQISDVAFFVFWSTMLFAERVDCNQTSQ